MHDPPEPSTSIMPPAAQRQQEAVVRELEAALQAALKINNMMEGHKQSFVEAKSRPGCHSFIESTNKAHFDTSNRSESASCAFPTTADLADKVARLHVHAVNLHVRGTWKSGNLENWEPGNPEI